ncbi:putative disease resistance protein RGA3 [Typha angustifolia]|uniref:putative disease resistance protein RGA3 n=1 Tax=Typha angustifolia TaxID=59011 RepID=UPI003C2F5B70
MAISMFGSAVVGELVSRASSFLERQHELQSGVKNKLERLRQLLIKVQSVIQATEGKQINNPALVQWLKEFKNLAYEADDVLDTFTYRELQRKAEGEVSFSATSSSNTSKRIRKVGKSTMFSKEDVNELSNLVKRLEKIAADVGDFLTLLSLDGQSKKPGVTGQRLTGALPANLHSFVGREKEKKEIIDILLKTESHEAGKVSVLPVLGIGGVGKTTLAQIVYRDERVRNHFSLTMWVCVSQSFDVAKLTREILEQATCHHNYNDAENFNRLQLILREIVSSEIFLLVLDDVWNETEREIWDILKAPLCYGKEGSKILLTSRLEKVAKLMGTMDPIKLEGLPEQEYLSFFKECAFGGAKPEEQPRLAAIGEKIAKKLKGSPLAAKTVGALLKGKLEDAHWESICKSDIWELEHDQDGIMSALKLSYLHLPVQLQQCFSYLSVTPKNWSFKREDVIRMWMAQSLIYQDGGKKRIEDIGEDYFNELISKSFFQPYIFDDQYIIHDLLHDLAESVSKDECYRIEDDEVKTIPATVRHLSVLTNNLAKLKENAFVLNNLRTFFFFYNKEVFLDVADLHYVFRQLKRIRMLRLANCHMEMLPINLCNLIHLRFLDLSKTGIRELPNELTKLYHLQTLDLTWQELNHVPASMNRLINLRYLMCSSVLLSKVAGIGKMTSLQELTCPFFVQNVPGFELGQLKHLKELRGYLSIRNLENVDSKEEAEEAKLFDKENLVKLHLCWESAERNAKIEVENGVLEALKPHPHLKELCIIGYKGTQSPYWMVHNSSTNLVVLKLIDCTAWEGLPPLGQLPWLKVLELRQMHAVKEVGRRFYGFGPVEGFPSLQELIFDDFPEWEVWTSYEKVHFFPHLRILRISRCPQLTAIPPLAPFIQKLVIRSVGLIVLPELLTASCQLTSSSSSSSSLSSSLRSLSIEGCLDLQSPGKWLLQQHDNLRYLERLRFDPWDEHKSLMLNGINKLIGLKNLYIRCSIPFASQDLEEREDGGLLPPSLDELTVFYCAVIDNVLSNCLKGLSSLRSLHIGRCSAITTIPFVMGMQQLTGLRRMKVTYCEELMSLEGLETLCSLEELEVVGCPKLTSVPCSRPKEVGLSSLSTLHIDNTLLLQVLLSRKGLASLEKLEIVCSYEWETSTEVFHNLSSLQLLHLERCPNLQTLPELKNLHSLKKLEMWFCRNVKSLPSKESLPPMLKHLSVRRCNPVFEERYHKGDGPDWPTIAHIPFVEIR